MKNVNILCSKVAKFYILSESSLILIQLELKTLTMKMFLTMILMSFISLQLNAFVECKHDFILQKATPGYERFPRHGLTRNQDLFLNLPTFKSLPKSDYAVDFKILVISSEDVEKHDPGLLAATTFLQNMWIPYEVLVLTKNGKRNPLKKLDLINTDGSGKYSGVVTTEYNLSFKTLVNGKEEYISALSKEEWAELFQYEKMFNVRHVSLFTYPDYYLGFTESVGSDHFKKNSIILNAEPIRKYLGGVNLNAEVEIKDNWHYPVDIVKERSNQIEPILFYTNIKNSIAGAVKKTDDQREEMHFFFSQSKNNMISKFIAPVWIKWLTKNIYQGKRRTYLTAQIDDYLTPTRIWNPLPHVKRLEYRTSVADIQNFIDFQKNYLRPETKDASYKIEMAFNGKGTFLYGGEGIDLLSNFTIKNAHEFFWVSHTYSHPELNDISYNEMVAEVNNNIDAAKYLLRDNYHLFSEFGLVTPRISGLYNKEALKAMYDLNISYLIGDNTKFDFRHPTNKHLPRATTTELNGFSGSHIIPRFPNDIYYNISTLPELEGLFNHYYELVGDNRFNYEKIFAKNAKETVGHLLEYDYSPYMFHQANMRVFDYNNTKESLLSLWFREVLKEYRKLSTFPLKSLSFNQLIEIYSERRSYEECKVSTRFIFAAKKLSSIQYLNEKECEFPITGLENTSLLETYRSENFGPDHTIYVNGKMGSINLGQSIILE